MNLKILFAISVLATLLFWTCDEKVPVAPEESIQSQVPDKKVPLGTVTPVLSLPAGNSPEGITLDKRGNLYISNTRGSVNEILLICDGTFKVFATLPGAGQVRGLVTDNHGNIFAAFATTDQNTLGVYCINKEGFVTRLNGSEGMAAPNALTFDRRGNLYATDSDAGAIWKYGRNGIFEKLIEDPLLAGGIVPGGPPFPLPGANGIAFYPPSKLYVANTAQNSICCVTLGRRGELPTVKVVKQDILLFNADGIVVDSKENIFVALPASTLGALGVPPVPPLVKLNPNNGILTPVVNDNTLFDTPTSLVLGRGHGNSGDIFIANAALQYGQPPMAGPGVVKVFVGM